MSFGKVERADLACPNGCGQLQHHQSMMLLLCYHCGWGVSERDIQSHCVRDLRQMIRDKAIGRQMGSDGCFLPADAT